MSNKCFVDEAGCIRYVKDLHPEYYETRDEGAYHSISILKPDWDGEMYVEAKYDLHDSKEAAIQAMVKGVYRE